MPNSAIAEGTYSLEASLVSFVDYDSWESCWETFTENNSENGTVETTYYHMCEETQNSDDYPSSNADAITGAISNYHDIRITTLTVFQGYDSNGGGETDDIVAKCSSALACFSHDFHCDLSRFLDVTIRKDKKKFFAAQPAGLTVR